MKSLNQKNINHLAKLSAGCTPAVIAEACSAGDQRLFRSQSLSIPQVPWSAVGGLEHVRQVIQEVIQLPLDHPERFKSGIKKKSGLLFHGPPGCGKSNYKLN